MCECKTYKVVAQDVTSGRVIEEREAETIDEAQEASDDMLACWSNAIVRIDEVDSA